MKRIVIVGALAVVASQIVTSPAHAVTTNRIEFGIDNGGTGQTGVQRMKLSGAEIEFGSMWAGKWNANNQWQGIRDQIRRNNGNGVTSMIQWYYWGDTISVTCVENENPLNCGGKTKTEWNLMAGQLADVIQQETAGERTVVVLETEFNKGGVENYEAFDGYLEAQANAFKAKPGIQVVIGFGHWMLQQSGVVDRFDRAMGAAHYGGTMILFSCVRESQATYTGAVQRLIDNATAINDRYNKPLFVNDFGLSSYSGASSGDSAYSATNPLHQCVSAGDYTALQNAEIQELFTRKQELKDAGVAAIVYRVNEDEVTRDPNIHHHRIAERWWGLRRNNVAKAAHGSFVSGVTTENQFGGEEWAQEAESFPTKTTGGQCTDVNASGGACWNIWANGSISTTMSTLTRVPKRINVRAKGDPSVGVWPLMEVYVDGTQIMNLSVASNQWTIYSAVITVGVGSHTIEVKFTNDANVNGDDRNLLVDSASVDIASRVWSQQAEAFTTKTTGQSTPSNGASGGAYWNLWGNGYIEHGMEPSSSLEERYEIHVVARGTVAGTVWPIMKVYVDGTLVLTQTVNTTIWKTYRIRRAMSGFGTHALRIEFTNDGVVGAEDRNLYVDVAHLYS